MPVDGCRQVGDPSIMQEEIPISETHQRLGPYLGGRGTGTADVRQVRAHVVEKQVGVEGDLTPIERVDVAGTGRQGWHMARRAPDPAETRLSSGHGCLRQSPGRPPPWRRREKPDVLGQKIERGLVHLGIGRRVDFGGWDFTL
jgi:hypothetical protein